MAAISAAQVKELRLKTDAPMMECKKALTEADGDMAKAEEILRVKLGNKATKAASRVTAEGVVVVYVSDDKKLGAILEVNSETDFVAKNPEFLQMAREAVKLVAEKNPADVAALLELPLGETTVEGVRKALVGKIGENMTFRRFARVEAQGFIEQYVHGSRIGVLVDMVGGNEELAHDIAMHIAATKPKAIDENRHRSRPDRLRTPHRHREGPRSRQARSHARTHRRRLRQEVPQRKSRSSTSRSLRTTKKSVADLLKAADAKIASYVLYVVGEGIEKRVDDFAAEVAAQQAAAAKA